MFSKPLGVVLFALACLTAAAGGAYVAARHNASDAAAVTTQSTAVPAPAASTAAQPATAPGPASKPVAETEAPVTTAKAEPAPAAGDARVAERPLAPSASKPVPARTAPPAAPARPTPKTAPVAAHEETPAPRASQRTVPMVNAGTPVSQPESSPQPVPPAVAASSAPKTGDSARGSEEPRPEPARVPQFDELILPSASVIGLQIETSTSTERARVEDRIDARVSRDVMAEGRVAIPAGSRVIGSVTTVERGGKIKEQARLGIRFHTLVLADGTQVQLHTDPVYRLGDAPAASSSKKIGGAAIGGAILGAILGGGKGAAIGGATGAAGGTAAVMAGDRSAAQLRQGEYLNVKLASPATITVEKRE